MTARRKRVVLITGASSGIGKACAELLSTRGYAVYGTSRRSVEAAPPGYPMLVMDVTQDDSVQRAVETVLAQERGYLDTVVNNAGYALAGAAEDTSIEEARAQLDANFLGALRVCKAVLPTMRKQGFGRIIQVSSLGGQVGLPFQSLYSASKFALEGFTEALRQEVAEFGIEATLVQPGDVRTHITQNRVRVAKAGAGSAYQERFEAALEAIESGERDGLVAEDVAKKVLAVMEREAPRVRYPVANLAQRAAVVAKAVLPSRTFEKLLMSLYGLRRR
ncbi:3-oxoacyl-[acyl-carrier protein] reductase [Myxococcus hansupus]|uniref:3-oxoacyl-[acyl-carrier protein] reductase n=1 Tax=Pseudomyxococcus hansupus TaxID=1297742 RepID=A0A0H4XM11_9BACT|nr:SDR family oxidoreductase [Myxococcus hansupus]AKQ69317.1 3-oxoacyl-[acyl-carrier protein] reductase [Myxococcus hansupus]